MNFIITKITLDDFELPVPVGLSELLNESNAWVYRPDNFKETSLKSGYNREVKLIDGELCTILTKKL